ncbi:MAG: hypothetical protein ACI9EW_001674 [Cellvibrionaceae bacterium]|jgi:hypothetical protein
MDDTDLDLPEDFEDFSHLSDEDGLDFISKAMLKPNADVIKDLATDDQAASDTLAIIDDSLSAMEIFDKLTQINQLIDHGIVAELIKLGKAVVHIRMKGHGSLAKTQPRRLQSEWDKLSQAGSLKTYVGTGWVFGSERKVMMTNNHVLPLIDTAKTANVYFEYITDFRSGRKSSKKIVKLAPEKLFFTSPALKFNGLDYTAVAFEEVSDEEFGFIEHQDGVTAKNATRVYVPQHPRGRPKTYVFHNNFKVNQSDNYMTYTSDTEGGSSGSPLFDDKLNLIGIHHVGNYSTHEEEMRLLTNLGSRIEVVIKDLAGQIKSAGWGEAQVKEWFGEGSVLSAFNG